MDSFFLPDLPDDVWQKIEPLLRDKPVRARGGRPPVNDRAVLHGILCVLANRVRWQLLPSELNFGSGMTCWRRLRTWRRQGKWTQIEAILRSNLPQAGRIDWSRAALVDPPSKDGKPTDPSGS